MNVCLEKKCLKLKLKSQKQHLLEFQPKVHTATKLGTSLR